MSEKRVLLVIDDEDIVREAVGDIMESVDVTVYAAANGHDGVEIFTERRSEIDGILLDMKMPGLSGPDTLREIRALDPEIPVILSSGYSEDETKRAISDQNAITFLPKPYNFNALVEAVGGILGVELL